MGPNAVADAIAQKYNATKSQVFDYVSEHPVCCTLTLGHRQRKKGERSCSGPSARFWPVMLKSWASSGAFSLGIMPSPVQAWLLVGWCGAKPEILISDDKLSAVWCFSAQHGE